MNVAFSIGEKSKMITNTLKKSADNVDFYSYSSIPEMTKESLARHIAFNRIVFSTQILDKNDPEGDLRVLNDFIKNYSNSTEIVMIVTTADHSGIDKVFTSMFNSPMYTPIILDKATAQSLLQIVTDDITRLKTQYYVLDVKQDKTIVSGSASESPKEPAPQSVEPREPEKKRGLFGIFKGGKNKNSAQTVEPVPAPESTVQDTPNIEEPAPEIDNHFSAGPTSVFTGFGGESAGSEVGAEKELEKKFEGFGNSTPSDESENLGAKFSVEDDEDSELSIGSYGEQHTDTGFLDDDEAEELKQLMEDGDNTEEDAKEESTSEPADGEWNSNATPVRSWEEKEAEKNEESWSKPEEPIIEEPKRYKPIRQPIAKPNREKTHIDMVVGVRGSGATQAIIDEAVSLVQDEDIKVLIIDLDTKENGILSYIDAERFYMEGANNGINKLRVYEEDGVGVISNGYGVPVSSRALLSLLNSKLLGNYSMVFIDCPLECMEAVSYEVVKKCNILIKSGIDRSDLVATSLALTNRDYVDFKVEKYLMENCLIEFKDEAECSPEDVEWVNRVCLFANGNWLDRIGM